MSFNGYWVFSIVVPIQVINLIFSVRSRYDELSRFYQEYSPSSLLNVVNIVANLFVFIVFLIAVFFDPLNLFLDLEILIIAIIAMMSFTSSSLVGEGFGQVIYERQNDVSQPSLEKANSQ